MEEIRLSYLLESHEIGADCQNMPFFPIGDYLLTQTIAQMLVLCTKGGNIKLLAHLYNINIQLY